MKNFLSVLLLLSAGFVGAAEVEKPLPVWNQAAVWPRHIQLRQQFIGAIQRGDIDMMESICRAALQTMPGDATWHYNLACALAHRDQPGLALTELEKAVNFGFRNADAIAQDSDFEKIKTLPRFAELVQKARDLVGKPFADRPTPTACTAPAGGTVTLNETNVVFNFDIGLYEAQLKLGKPRTALPALATRYSASKPASPECPLMAAWLSEGSAAGNAGDLYVNRDAGHSMLAVADFPQLTAIRFSADARKANVDLNHPNTLFPNCAVFGNISRAYKNSVLWRSMARASFTHPNLATHLNILYLNNQFWCMPCIDDFGNKELGDIYPANAPFQLISKGISWSDQPFVRAAVAASAAFRKPTKQAIIRRHLMGPTLQWLLRRSQKGIVSDEDYLSEKAHPTVFDAKRLDTVRLVSMAHDLEMQQVPPAVQLALVNSKLFPVRYPLPLVDYPDPAGELLFMTPTAMAFTLRAPAGERTFLVRAETLPEKDPTATYIWRVVHGDAAAVKITRPLGELLLAPETGYAQITIDRRALTNRIDVAVFAKSNGTTYGAPSIISFSPVSQERRVYRPDGQIASIDYANKDLVYCDPLIALPRRWKDVYTYDAAGKPTGYQRFYDTKLAAEFMTNGDRIVARDANGQPTKAVHVKYTTRETGDPTRPQELTFMDEGKPFDVK